MNAQILYATMTGHSKKIAQSISKETGIPVYDLKTKPQIPACDLLIIVSGIYGGEYKKDLLDFVKTLSSNNIRKVVLVTSSTMNKKQGSLKATLEQAGLKVNKEEYHCQGSFLFKAMGHPNQEEISNAIKFVKKQLAE